MLIKDYLEDTVLEWKYYSALVINSQYERVVLNEINDLFIKYLLVTYLFQVDNI